MGMGELVDQRNYMYRKGEFTGSRKLVFGDEEANAWK